MIIRILFYKAERDGHPLDDAINIYTALFNFPRPRWNPKKWWQEIKQWWKGCYSHVELWVPSEHAPGAFGIINSMGEQPEYLGTCYTSTMRPPDKGVVKNPASKILKNPKRWDMCEIEIKDSLYEGGINYLMARIGKKIKYAFKTIASYFLPIRLHEEDADVCGELIYDVLVIWAIFSAKNKCPSPRRLSRWLTKKGYEIKPLEA